MTRRKINIHVTNLLVSLFWTCHFERYSMEYTKVSSNITLNAAALKKKMCLIYRAGSIVD